ncbi:MAG: biopolymer transporter ExbD [Verrucomicrobiae bacterium]|nr:biopolymer transporter ExbD [Verrucomicrobiae bacterium]MCP5521070.1 biopolymer transporter ExbD [Verrucomicrobiales bacterium]
MKFVRHVRPFTGQLDAAPLASLFFLLLLFLLFHTYLVPPPGIRVELPVVGTPNLPGTANPWLAVTVDQVGRLYFESQVVTGEDLARRLAARVREQQEPVSLLVQADRRVPQEVVLRLYAVARSAGLREVVIATRPELFEAPEDAEGP